MTLQQFLRRSQRTSQRGWPTRFPTLPLNLGVAQQRTGILWCVLIRKISHSAMSAPSGSDPAHSQQQNSQSDGNENTEDLAKFVSFVLSCFPLSSSSCIHFCLLVCVGWNPVRRHGKLHSFALPPVRAGPLLAFDFLLSLSLSTQQSKFQQMSEQIIGRLDEMGQRVDDLEKNISDLMQQVEAREESSSSEQK